MYVPDIGKEINPNLSLTLNGGSFNLSGDGTWGKGTASSNVTFRDLTLSADSFITMGIGNGSTTLNFTNLLLNPGGNALSVFGWGDATSDRHILVGSSPDATTLNNMWFEGYLTGGADYILGELVPRGPFTAPGGACSKRSIHRSCPDPR